MDEQENRLIYFAPVLRAAGFAVELAHTVGAAAREMADELRADEPRPAGPGDDAVAHVPGVEWDVWSACTQPGCSGTVHAHGADPDGGNDFEDPAACCDTCGASYTVHFHNG